MGVYPFMFGTIKDFEGIIESGTKAGLKEPYNWDEYAETFLPKGKELKEKAEAAEKEGDKEKASEYYM